MLRPLALAAPVFLAGCIPSAAPPPVATPAPTPAATPAPVRTQAPVALPPRVDNWIDAPQTRGDWRYNAKPAGGGTAFFGNTATDVLFTVDCDRRAGQAPVLRLLRQGQSTGPRQMRIRTETMDRALTVRPDGAFVSSLVAVVPAGDPLLDAMALTRGRFAVEVEGLPPLYLPAWAEVSRAIEDCR
ncbi:hypothetical protein [Qipengyuania sp. JC766]|uniref:hypothetical protein n=1 Tax=Qipengyuania sp. JC766 TaxID=3232139 RepID=UPI0034590D1E